MMWHRGHDGGDSIYNWLFLWDNNCFCSRHSRVRRGLLAKLAAHRAPPPPPLHLHLSQALPGEHILKAGEPATFFALVLQGSATKISEGSDSTKFEMGDLIGHMPLFLGGGRKHDVVVLQEAVLATFKYNKLLDFTSLYPDLGVKVRLWPCRVWDETSRIRNSFLAAEYGHTVMYTVL